MDCTDITMLIMGGIGACFVFSFLIMGVISGKYKEILKMIGVAIFVPAGLLLVALIIRFIVGLFMSC